MCEEYTLNILRNGDGKKDEKVDHETFNLVDLLRSLNYAELQLSSLIDKLQDDEARTLARGAYGTLYGVIVCLEDQVRKTEPQKGN